MRWGFTLVWKPMLLLGLVLSVLAFPSSGSATPDDPFTGVWIGGSGVPGGIVRIRVSSATPEGVRHVTFTDDLGGLGRCWAQGFGTESGNTVGGTWNMYCDGQLLQPSPRSWDLFHPLPDLMFFGSLLLTPVGNGHDP